MLIKDIAFLSRLYFTKSNKSLAYCFWYLDSNNKLWYYISAIDPNYKNIGTGKILIQCLANESQVRGYKSIDLGRGSQYYKYRFANQDTLLYNLITYNNNKIAYKIRKITDNFTQKALDNNLIAKLSKYLQEIKSGLFGLQIFFYAYTACII